MPHNLVQLRQARAGGPFKPGVRLSGAVGALALAPNLPILELAPTNQCLPKRESWAARSINRNPKPTNRLRAISPHNFWLHSCTKCSTWNIRAICTGAAPGGSPTSFPSDRYSFRGFPALLLSRFWRNRPGTRSNVYNLPHRWRSLLRPYEIVRSFSTGRAWRGVSPQYAHLGRDVALKVDCHSHLSAKVTGCAASSRKTRPSHARPSEHCHCMTWPHDGAPFLIAELLEGESLREKSSPAALGHWIARCRFRKGWRRHMAKGSSTAI